MVWKIERWMAEVFPGEENIYEEYRRLPSRELAIVCASVLDVALAELLSMRLRDNRKEAEDFLGLNGDGRAPAGSFGARIQLAVLVGLLTPEDAAVFRKVKALRNLFAHRVKIDFTSPAVVTVLLELHKIWIKRNEHLLDRQYLKGNTAALAQMGAQIPTDPIAGEAFLLVVFGVYHAYLHRLHSLVRPVKLVVHET